MHVCAYKTHQILHFKLLQLDINGFIGWSVSMYRELQVEFPHLIIAKMFYLRTTAMQSTSSLIRLSRVSLGYKTFVAKLAIGSSVL